MGLIKRKRVVDIYLGSAMAHPYFWGIRRLRPRGPTFVRIDSLPGNKGNLLATFSFCY